MIKRLLVGLLAAALALPAVAAERRPLVIGATGQQQQIQNGDTLKTPATATGAASINIPHGTAPSSPNNGDLWSTTSGFYGRVNGSTVGPFGSGGGSPGGSSGQIQYNNAGAFGGFTLGGDCTFSVPNVTCTKTSGVSFGYFATGTDAANLSGTVSVNRFNSGTGASSSTFLRGDGTWVTPSGGSGTVTTTGSPANGNLTKFSGSTSITNGDLSGDVTTSGALATTIGNSKVTLAKIANASASSKLVGSGASGSGSAYSEISLGTGLAMSGTTLSASASGSIGALVLITETVTSGSASNVSFTSISNGYRDLRVVVRGRGSKSAANALLRIRFNGDTGSNYDYSKYDATGNGAGGTPSGGTGNATTSADFGYLSGATATADLASGTELTVFDYKGTTFKKSGRSVGNIASGTTATSNFITNGVIVWRNTSAITQIDVFPDSGNFVDGSVVSLYGVF